MTGIRARSEVSEDSTSFAKEMKQRIVDEIADGNAPGAPAGRFVITPYSGHGPAPAVMPAADGDKSPPQPGYRQVMDTGSYSWIFGELPGCLSKPELIKDLGAPCGPMDFNPPTEGPCAQLGRSLTLEELPLYEARPTEEAQTDPLKAGIPAGYTYLGQFLDHNITFQAEATFDHNRVDQVTNFHSGRIDLTHVYGLGPKTQAFQYYDNQDPGGGGVVRAARQLARHPQDRPVRRGDHCGFIPCIRYLPE